MVQWPTGANMLHIQKCGVTTETLLRYASVPQIHKHTSNKQMRIKYIKCNADTEMLQIQKGAANIEMHCRYRITSIIVMG